MQIFDNYVYMTITEKTMELYKNSMCLSYRGYCINIKNLIKVNNITDGTARDMVQIYQTLKTIYNMEVDEAYDYIYNFFGDSLYIKFEEVVRLTNTIYSNSYS